MVPIVDASIAVHDGGAHSICYDLSIAPLLPPPLASSIRLTSMIYNSVYDCTHLSVWGEGGQFLHLVTVIGPKNRGKSPRLLFG